MRVEILDDEENKTEYLIKSVSTIFALFAWGMLSLTATTQIIPNIIFGISMLYLFGYIIYHINYYVKKTHMK